MLIQAFDKSMLALEIIMERKVARSGAPSAFLPFIAVLAAARFVAAFNLHVADCDEVFNFVEPVHLTLYGGGLETWEYSPTYALRSWAYVLVHSLFVLPAVAAGLAPHLVFFLLRCAVVCCYSSLESVFLYALSCTVGSNVAWTTCIILAISPGPLSQSIAVLPSSFAAAALTAAYGYSLLIFGTHPSGAAQSLFRFVFAAGSAATFGWPFAAPCAFPGAAVVLRYGGLLRTLGVCAALAALFISVGAVVDTAMYGTPNAISSTLNLILYNVIHAPAGGAELYGVEPPTWYIKNLSVCLPATFLFAFLGAVVAVVDAVRGGLGRAGTHASSSASVAAAATKVVCCVAAPATLWLTFMSLQPHKEERFMTPIYSLICAMGGYFVCRVGGKGAAGRGGLGAVEGGKTVGLGGGSHVRRSASPSMASAVEDDVVKGGGGGVRRRGHQLRSEVKTAKALSPTRANEVSKVGGGVVSLNVGGWVLLGGLVVVSLLRVGALSLYAAPLHAWSALPSLPEARVLSGVAAAVGDGAAPPSVCVGREWYRFPSSFFLHPQPLSESVFTTLRGVVGNATIPGREGPTLDALRWRRRGGAESAVRVVATDGDSPQRRVVGDIEASSRLPSGDGGRGRGVVGMLQRVFGSVISKVSPVAMKSRSVVGRLIGAEDTSVHPLRAVPLEILWVDDGFGGQLPRPYWPPTLPHAATAVHADFSNLNARDASRFVQASECDFVVDSAFTGDTSQLSDGTPSLRDAVSGWRVVGEFPVMDSSATPTSRRLGNLPWALQAFVPKAFRPAVGYYRIYMSPQAERVYNETIRLVGEVL